MGVSEIKEKFNHYYTLCGLEDGHGVFYKCKIFCDMVFSQYCCGIRGGEYFSYQFFHVNNEGRKKYMTDRRLRKMIYTCNDRNYFNIFRDKSTFNAHFENFQGRSWIDLNTCTEEEFLVFVQKYPQCFGKFTDGKQGIGAQKLDFTVTSPKNFFDENKGKRLILEELIVQHTELNQLNPSSVNTLRVITLLCADNQPRIIAAVLRLGRAGESIDNFSQNGIAAPIDIETGIISTTGVDGKFNRYTLHPDSGKQIVGFKIPLWNELTAMVKEVAMVVPKVRFVGWDFAIREHDVVLVEGNEYPGTRVWEMPCHEGLWPRLKPYIEKIAAMK